MLQSLQEELFLFIVVNIDPVQNPSNGTLPWLTPSIYPVFPVWNVSNKIKSKPAPCTSIESRKL